MEVISKTHVGLCRPDNQDRVKAESWSQDTALAVLCDGMGGGEAGGEASELALERVFSRIKEGFDPNMDVNSLRNLLISAATAANALVYTTASESKRRGMGTTCVIALAAKGNLHLVNIGDSRAYCMKNGVLEQITEDHSVVRMLLEQGEIEAQEALDHPQRHVITRAVGVERDLLPDYFETSFDLTEGCGDKLLLCSDGLYNYCNHEIMSGLLRDFPPSVAAEELLNRALDNGGRDNISLAIIG